MRRFLLPVLACLALALGAGTAKAQLIVASPYSGVYTSGYMSVAPSTVYVAPSYVAPSVSYYGSYYPSYTYGSYYPYTTGYYSSYYPSYASSYYYPSYYGGGYYGSYHPYRSSRWRW